MADAPPDDGTAPSPASGGLLGTVREFVLTVVQLLQTRLEIFASDLDEERLRLRGFLWLAAATIFCLGFAVVLGVVFVVAMLWDRFGVLAIGILSLVFLALGTALTLAIRNRARSRPRLFATTLDEFAKDRDRLTPRR